MPRKIKEDNYDDVAMPTLLRFAWKTYRAAMQNALHEAGCGDIPHNGVYIIAGMGRGLSWATLRKELGINKGEQEALIAELMLRKYVEKNKNAIELSLRGKKAALAIKAANDGVDRELDAEVGQESIAQAKQILAVIIDIFDKKYHLPRGKR